MMLWKRSHFACGNGSVTGLTMNKSLLIGVVVPLDTSEWNFHILEIVHRVVEEVVLYVGGEKVCFLIGNDTVKE